MKLMMYILSILFLINHTTYGQNQYFNFSAIKASCDIANGSINIQAMQQASITYPFPWTVELVHPDGSDSYYDLNGALVIGELNKGVYQVRVWLDEDNGCKVDFDVTIDEQDTPLNASVIFSCNTNCIDLTISTSSGPFEVAWFKKIANGGFSILPGYPKINLAGNNGLEDLCGQQAGIYKVVVTDTQCGEKELSLAIDPCDCFEINLMDKKNVTHCENLDTWPPQPPSESCDGQITLSVSGVLNVSAIWSNGATGLSVSNLCTGIYSVTISNGSCSKIEHFEICCCSFISNNNNSGDILLCSDSGIPPQIFISGTATNASSETSFDGSINVTVSGGSSGIRLEWTGPNGFTSTQQNLTNLAHGTYKLNVFDGCSSAEKVFIVLACSQTNFLNSSKIFDACPSTNNGEITLNVPSGIGVFWQLPSQQVGNTIKDLAPGTYCANLIHLFNGCIQNMCFTVGIADPLVIEASNVQPSCNSHDSGSALITFNNTNQPYYAYNIYNNTEMKFLGDGNVYYQSSPEINIQASNLSPGDYTFFTLNRCGYNSTNFSIVESELDVEVITTIGCDDNSSITLIPTGDNPPYTYKWDWGLLPVAVQTNLKRNVYNVTITDSKGCNITRQINDLKPDVEMLKKIPACIGLWDGEATIQINNPTNENVIITYGISACSDCTSFPINVPDPMANPIVFTLDGLAGNTTYSIWVIIGQCVTEFKFFIPEEKINREFSSFEEVGEDKIVCIYDEICKDNVFEDNIEEPATLKEEPGKCEGAAAGILFGAFSDCGENQFFCDDTLVHRKDAGTISLRMGEWVAWITALGHSVETATQTPGDYCSYIRVCENMPLCLLGGGRWNLTGGHMVGSQGPDENGCITIICASNWFFDPAPDYTICGLDFLPEYIPFHYDPDLPGKCERTTKSMAEMIAFIDQMASKYGEDFTESSLLVELNKYRTDPRRNCATITFCQCKRGNCETNFEFVSTDIDEVICGPIEPPFTDGGLSGPIAATCSEFIGYSDGDPMQYVWCDNGQCPPSGIDSTCIKPVILNLTDFNKFNLFRKNDNPNVIVMNNKENIYFRRFSKADYQSLPTVAHGIFYNTTKSFFHWNDTEDWTPRINQEADFAYQDFNTNLGFRIIRLPSGYRFSTSSGLRSLTSSSTTIKSDISFQVLDMQTYQNNYLVKSLCKGTISNQVNNVLHSGSTYESVFYLFDETNTIIRKEYIGGFLDTNSVHYGKGMTTYIQSEPYTSFNISGTTYTTTNMKSVVKVKDNYDGTFTKSETIKWNGVNKLLRVEENLETNSTIYVFEGFGGFIAPNVTVPSSSTKKLYLVREHNKEIKHWKVINDLTNIDVKNISTTSDANGNLYVGLNFQNSISSSDFNLTSAGSYDIALLKYNANGTFAGFKKYGSVDYEGVKELYWNSNILYLGGDINGPSTFRNIGELTFAKFTPQFNQAFISIENPLDFNSGSIQNTNIENRASISKSTFTVFPNPTSDILTLDFKHSVESNLLVHVENTNGTIVFRTQIAPNSINNNTFALNLVGIPSGVYIVKVRDESNNVNIQKFIKI